MAEKKGGRRTRTSSADKPSEKRTYFRQADFPQTTLQQAQKIASALVDNFAGRGGSPPDIALSSGPSGVLCAAAEPARYPDMRMHRTVHQRRSDALVPGRLMRGVGRTSVMGSKSKIIAMSNV